MYYVTCQNHTNLRWLVKGIALNRNGRYNRSRNLHFIGRLMTEAEKKARPEIAAETRYTCIDVNDAVKECPCDASALTVAHESIDEFQREMMPTDEQMTEIHERLKPKPVPVPTWKYTFLQWYRDVSRYDGQRAADKTEGVIQTFDVWPVARLMFTDSEDRDKKWGELFRCFGVNAIAVYSNEAPEVQAPIPRWEH